MEKHIYHLEGLHCANCALNIEAELNKQDYIENAVIDFTNLKLVITYDDSHYNDLVKILSKYEDGVTIKQDDHEHEHSDLNKVNLGLFIGAIVLVIINFLFKFEGVTKIIVFFIAYIMISYDILIKLVKNLFAKRLLDEAFLMGIATVAAFAIGDYLEAIAIMLFYKIGEFFEDMAVNRSRKSISSLVDIQPKFANLLVDGIEQQVDPATVEIGSKIIVKAGERVPLDGKVIEGESYLDMRELTGESRDVKIGADEEILSGSINKTGTLTIETTKKYADSTVARILELVENSSTNKAKTENFITKFAQVYTPVIVLLAVIVAVIPPLVTDFDFYTWIYRALIFLVLACPCALVISIPLGFFGGIGNASKHGILIKGSNYLEALNDVEVIAFDKTGTLTKGNFTLINMETFNGFSKDDVLKYSAYLESNSNHPLGLAIVESYDEPINKNIIKDYQEIAGMGLSANIEDKDLLIGNEKLMEENNIKFDLYEGRGTIVYLAINNVYAGFLEIADEIKGSSEIALKRLKKLGIKELIMLTGDNNTVAQAVADKLGITKVFSRLLPDQKVEKLNEIKELGTNAFVGDGINDAPILMQADVGIAMGGVGSDAAIEASDIVIMDDDINKIADAIKIANKTKRIVVENIVIALGVKLLVLILGIFGLAQIWEAVIADVGVALVAILNTMRVLYYKVDDKDE